MRKSMSSSILLTLLCAPFPVILAGCGSDDKTPGAQNASGGATHMTGGGGGTATGACDAADRTAFETPLELHRDLRSLCR